MLKKISVVLFLMSLLTPFQSMAQKGAKKYVVFIFEDTRYYSEYGKRSRQSESYFWISSVDSLLNDGVLYPLYLPFQEEGSVLVHDDIVYLSSLTNENGLMKLDDPKQNRDSFCYLFIKWLNENKVKKQSIVIRHKSLSKHPLQKIKEEINIYFVPVLGQFCEGILRIDDNRSIRSYYVLDGERIEKANLDEKEMNAVSFFDCSLVDFSSFIEPYSVYHKGHSLLKSVVVDNKNDHCCPELFFHNVSCPTDPASGT